MATKANLAERDVRFKRTREAMEDKGLEGLLVGGKGHMWTGRGYFRYFTDFHMWGHDALLLLPLDSDPVLTATSFGVTRIVKELGWVTDTRGECNLCDYTPQMIEAIKEKELSNSKLGIAGGEWIIPFEVYQRLQKQLPNVEFVKADELVDRVRMAKSPLEIKQIREFWEVSRVAMERFVEVVEPGKTGWELAAEACKITRAGGGREEFILLNEKDFQGPPRDVPVKCDDILTYHMENCGPSGHYVEITVKCAYREPTDLEEKLMDSELKAQDAILEMAKPGVRCSELAQIFESVLIEDGWEFGPPKMHFDFHGMGMDVVERPWWDEAQPSGPQDWELPTGTVLCYHPARNVKHTGTCEDTGICDVIAITPQGGERLSGDWPHRWWRMDK